MSKNKTMSYNDDCSTCNFGEHLTIDGYDGDQRKLNDKDLILKCLNELPEVLGMNKLAEPQVYFVPDTKRKDPGGWSGFVVIVESHISIHTFPARKFVSADVYTCRDGLNKEFIVDYFKEKFRLQDVEINLIKRGTRYPKYNLT
jgi:S-adenosylmethionine decarboxylase